MSLDFAILDAVRRVIREEVEPLRRQVEQLQARYREEAVPIDEAAERLRVSPKTVRRRIADGSLPAVRIGGVWRVQVGRALQDSPARR